MASSEKLIEKWLKKNLKVSETFGPTPSSPTCNQSSRKYRMGRKDFKKSRLKSSSLRQKSNRQIYSEPLPNKGEKNQKTKLGKRVSASKMKMKINSWKQQDKNDTFHRRAMGRLMGLHPKCRRPEILRLRRAVTKKNTCQPKGIARKINLQK